MDEPKELLAGSMRLQNAVGECVAEYLELRHEPEQRFRRVYKVIEPKVTGRPQDTLDAESLEKILSREGS